MAEKKKETRKEKRARVARIFEDIKELGYNFNEEKAETAVVGDCEVLFIPYTNISECCSKCFLLHKNEKKCLPCRSFERGDGRDGYWRFYRKKPEFDAIEERKRNNLFRKKKKEKGG